MTRAGRVIRRLRSAADPLIARCNVTQPQKPTEPDPPKPDDADVEPDDKDREKPDPEEGDAVTGVQPLEADEIPEAGR